MAYGKKNVIKLDVLNYNTGLIGSGGIGKTTVIKEMCEKLAGEDGYLFLECGKEDGADAINDINYVNCPDWNSEYDELTNSVGFKNVIDDIVENKKTDYPNLRVVIVDTYDQLSEIAEEEVIRLHNKEHSDKKVKSIKAAFGGYMAGEDMADDMVLDMLWDLKKVGVHFIILGHTKIREVTDSVTGDVYTQVTTDMSMRSFNKIKTKLHFLGVAYVDREIVKEKKNKKEIKTVKNEARKITFRDDNFALDSKSRFADIVDSIPLDADELIKALTDAIEKEAKKSKKSMDELQKEQDVYDKKMAERADTYSESVKASKLDPDKNKELVAVIKSKFKSTEGNKEKVKTAFTKYEVSNFSDAETTIPTAVLSELLDSMEQ